MAHSARSGKYPSQGDSPQVIVVMIREGSMVRRSPLRSTMLPLHGPEIMVATVTTVVTAPART